MTPVLSNSSPIYQKGGVAVLCPVAVLGTFPYILIPKPHFSSREGIISRCRFDLLHFPVLAQSDAARPSLYIIAVVAAHVRSMSIAIDRP